MVRPTYWRSVTPPTTSPPKIGDGSTENRSVMKCSERMRRTQAVEQRMADTIVRWRHWRRSRRESRL